MQSGVGDGNRRKVHPAEQSDKVVVGLENLSEKHLLANDNECSDDSRSRLVGVAPVENEFSFNDNMIKKD